MNINKLIAYDYGFYQVSILNKIYLTKLIGNLPVCSILNVTTSDTSSSSNENYKINNIFNGSRFNRWSYSWHIFINEYTWIQKIIGDGFNYIHKFGKKYLKDDSIVDYPHNPIISSFLYSGLVGGLFYIYYLILVFLYYWKYRKHHMIFFILYCITFYFMMFSGNSHFSVPIFTFLSIIPFLTKYFVEKKKIIKNDAV